MTTLDLIFILFLFAMGASVGSFLNVVVWRLPRGQSLVSPPSHCPRCNHKLGLADNIPVFGWIFLKGRCRYCSQPISPRYPIVEGITGLLLVAYYLLFFKAGLGPCAPQPNLQIDDLTGHFRVIPIRMSGIMEDWPIYSLLMAMTCALLASSLIDLELFIIPIEIPWLIAVLGLVVHALADGPSVPGAVSVTSPITAALAAGGALGLALGMLLFKLKIIPQSFPDGEPILDVDRVAYAREVAQAKAAGQEEPEPLPPDYTRPQIRREIGKEILFLVPPLLGAVAAVYLTAKVAPINRCWLSTVMGSWWATGLLGALLGAMIGAMAIWAARILGTLAMGRVAMGLGDVHLMFGVGAVIGAGPAVVAFFLAPFFGLIVGVYMFLTRRQRELPYGPYLSLATAAVLLCYNPIAQYMGPGLQPIADALRRGVGL